MNEADKGKKPSGISDMPEGLRAIADIPAEAEHKLISAAPIAADGAILLPAAAGAKPQPERPKTPHEQELDALITKRQGIIEQLKAKNPSVAECRKRIAEAIPALQGRGASHTMKLVEEAERLEFSIATEADTPKKEKEMIKRLRLINEEISKHKEIDSARKMVDSERSNLRALLSEIRSLEHELGLARKACDEKYAEVLAERKAAFEQRQKGREARARRQGEESQHRFEALRERVHREKKQEYDSDIAKYMKDYDDTVSMDEICVIEKKSPEKEKKKEE